MYHRVVLSLLFLSVITHAYPLQEHTDEHIYQINVGPLFNFARYNIGALPKIQGYLAGIHTDVQINTKQCIYTGLFFDGRWNAGFVCGDQDTKSHIKDYRPQWFVGYNLHTCENSLTIRPFTGFGFYYLSQELKPNIMTFRYFALFPPAGLSVCWDVCPDYFSVSLSALYRPYVWTRLKLDTPCIEQCEREKIRLNYSQGLHVTVPLVWNASCHSCFDVQVKVVPFFDWNHFARANKANSNRICFEVPRLDRWYLGLHVDLGFVF